MRAQYFFKLVIFLVILVSIQNNSCASGNSRFQGNYSDLRNAWNRVRGEEKEVADKRGRGLFGPLFSISKVLNFFPVGGERECQPEGYTVAKAGICLNPYDCRQRDGKASGDCADGLGVCCVFEVSCGGVVQNNLTYFMSPGFPELWGGDQDCNITIEKTHAGIMQLRIDFLHFTIGQPNRKTGECDEDAMILGDRDGNFTLCGQNHGQHVYYTLSSASEKRDTGDLAGSKGIDLVMRMRGSEMPRLWLMRVAQMPLAQSAPHECLQYYTTDNGTIRTFNYATNGRHLASQDYKACIRRNKNFCAVRYAPCDARSFRIESGNGVTSTMDSEGTTESDLGPGELGGAGGGFDGPEGSFGPTTAAPETTTVVLMDQLAADTQNASEDQMMAVSTEAPQNDDIEGSGDDPQMDGDPQKTSQTPMQPGIMASIWSYIRSWFWNQARAGRRLRWSPYAQHFPDADDDGLRYYGYGNYGAGMTGFGRQRCQDRVTIPCENEYFVSSSMYGAGVCDPHHCGSSFCAGGGAGGAGAAPDAPGGVRAPPAHCRVDTSIAPFAVSVHFGPPTVKPNPEDNIGMCLRYTQLPCDT